MTTGDSGMKKWSVGLLWLGTGLLSWCLTVYVFHFLVSPLFIESFRTINAGGHPMLIKHVANMFYSHMPAFLLGFLFAFILGLYSDATPPRVLLFVIGAVAVALYLQVGSLFAYWRQYDEIPGWAVASIVQGFISSLLIVPLLSVCGSSIGSLLRSRRKQ